MADVAVMVQAVDFIEAHLREPIGVAEMAEAAAYSIYYFCRTFHAITHHTPYDYLMRRRIAEAAHDLLEEDDRVIDVAFDYQFNNPETFSRAFKRVLGTTPSQWRKQGHAGYRQIMPPLTAAHLHHFERIASPRPQVKELPKLALEGIAAVSPDVNAERAARTWLLRELERYRVKPHDFYGLRHYAKDGKCVSYMVAVDAAAHGGLSAGGGSALVNKVLPPQHCVKVTHRGAARDLALTLDYVYHTWLPQSGFRAAQRYILEHYRPMLPYPGVEGGEWQVYVPAAPTE